MTTNRHGQAQEIKGRYAMELANARFFWSGEEMQFAVFSDDICRARFLERIPLPLIRREVEMYDIEPGKNAHWVLVQQTDGEKQRMKYFARRGKRFVEGSLKKLPLKVRRAVHNRIPAPLCSLA
jgi:hypothetical protein